MLSQGIAALVASRPGMGLAAEACNRREAVEPFRKHRLDATLMDFETPEMNGIDAVGAIRGEYLGVRPVNVFGSPRSAPTPPRCHRTP